MNETERPEEPAEGDFFERLPEEVQQQVLEKRDQQARFVAANAALRLQAKIGALCVGAVSFALVAPLSGGSGVPFVVLTALGGLLTAHLITARNLDMLLSAPLAGVAGLITAGLAAALGLMVVSTEKGSAIGLALAFMAWCAIGAFLSAFASQHSEAARARAGLWSIKPWDRLERPPGVVLSEAGAAKAAELPLSPFWTGAVFSAVAELVLQNDCAPLVLAMALGSGFIASLIKKWDIDPQTAAASGGALFLALAIVPYFLGVVPLYHLCGVAL
ncbi:MAG: hypothetical protein ABSE73_29515, partial [Planctomycetota bacterium]